MRNKPFKLLILLIISFCLICVLKAEEEETTDIPCIPGPEGTINIKWNGKRSKVGSVYTCVFPIETVDAPITDGEHYPSEEEAKEVCINQPEIDHWVKPSCCNSDDPKSGCSGSSACTKPQCIITTHCPSFNRGDATIYIRRKFKSQGDSKPYEIKYDSINLTFDENETVISWSDTGNYTKISYSGNNATVTAKAAGGSDSICVETADVKKCVSITVAYDDTYDPPEAEPGKPFETKNSTVNRITIDSKILLADGKSEKSECYYTWEIPHKEVTILGDCQPSTKDVYSYSYTIESTGDPAYCLQPGAIGPGVSGLQYVLDTQFDVSKCDDQFVNKDGEKNVECGLAQILFQTVKKAETSSEPIVTIIDGEEVTGEATQYVSTGEYSDEAITLALRLWMAQYGKQQYGLKIGDGDTSDPILEWIPKEDFYEVTAKAITGGNTYDTSHKNASEEHRNLIFCREDETPGKCDIDKAIELFHKAESATKDTYLGGLNFSKEVPVVKYHQRTEYEGETEIGLPEEIGEVILPCTDEDIKNGICDIQVKYFITDPSTGKEIEITEDVYLSGYCDKHRCIITTTAQKVCDEIRYPGGYTEWTVKVYVKNWSRNTGWVKFYTAAKDPQKYQKMISFDFHAEDCSAEEKIKSRDHIEEKIVVECPCSPTTQCPELSPTEDLAKTCSSADYTKSTITGPYMNCILHACHPSQTEEYKYTTKYHLDENVCNLYCKDDMEFYMPGRTSVYAGMQFRYDLAKILIDNNVSSELAGGKDIFKNTLAGSDQKLTSIVIVKRQCTSQINYEYWEKVYYDKLDTLALVYSSGNENAKTTATREVSQWLYELQNCNLYTSSQIVDPYNSAVHKTENGTSKEYALTHALCGNKSECPTLSVKYQDENYGVAKIQNKSSLISSTSNKTYYCKNGDDGVCYEYKQGEPVEINAGNYSSSKTKQLTYKVCSDSSCRDSSDKITVPINDYATFMILSESDFYQGAKYKSNVYTGEVKESDSSMSATEWVDLPNNIYPVSLDVETGTYNINYTFKNIPYRNINNYEHTCTYDVYNTTVRYDCNYSMDDGNLDISNCKNTCVQNDETGIPVIESSCALWDNNTSNSKNYGFVFRTVDLENLFPDISTRDPGINWVGTDEQTKTKNQQIISDIEKSASDIYTNDRYLNYQYVLTPDAIKLIKQYNENQSKFGGYLNSTLVDCKLSEGKEFKECKSTFLKELKIGDFNRAGVQVSGNRS